jgi:rubredoxin
MTEESFKVWQCLNCGYIYDEEAGDAEEGFAPGTRWADIPEDWICPQCGSSKIDFEMVEM